MLLQYLSL